MSTFDVADEAIDLEEGRMNQGATVVLRRSWGRLVVA
jgi:hypothetical protein